MERPTAGRRRERAMGRATTGGFAHASVDAETEVYEVYRAHFGQLAGWAAHLLGDRDLGHDVATEAFVKLINTWEAVDQPRPWLYTTAGNLVKDHWRKRGRESAAYRRYQGGADPDLQVHRGPDRDTLLTVRAAVEELPERFRLPVLLFYFGDLTVAEIARELGKAEGTIKSDLHAARARLATALEGAR